jgi:uncharacterized membrane protein
MATTFTLDTATAQPLPAIRSLTIHDLFDALAKGIDDAKAKPSFAPFCAAIYVVASVLAIMVVFDYDYLPLLFPVVSGAVLIGPFVTIALCEVSRRRERGLDYAELQGYNFFNAPGIKDIVFLGLLMIALFMFWLATAMTLYGLTVGDVWRSVPEAPASLMGFASSLFSTGEGWTLIILGNVFGFCFAVVSLCIGTFSFPLLLDRNIGIGAAVQTSVAAVKHNPIAMAVWGLIVVVLLLAGAIPFLAGLALVVPVLGHATWHLYRKAVV